jgi:hypothetical protein
LLGALVRTRLVTARARALSAYALGSLGVYWMIDGLDALAA